MLNSYGVCVCVCIKQMLLQDVYVYLDYYIEEKVMDSRSRFPTLGRWHRFSHLNMWNWFEIEAAMIISLYNAHQTTAYVHSHRYPIDFLHMKIQILYRITIEDSTSVQTIN